MNCPICHSNHTKLKFLKNQYEILHCLDCSHLFTDFQPSAKEASEIYSDEYFYNGGVGYMDYTLEKDMLIKRGEYYADKISGYKSTGKVLDIGAAAGFILKGFENKGWTGTGIELNKTMVEYGKKSLGVSLIQGSIENTPLEEKFDLIIMIQVIAHIYDLRASVNKIKHLLKPDGIVLIETWNKDSLTARLSGKNWHEFSPPSTLNYFSKRTLDFLMTKSGFSKIDTGTPRKSIHSKHAKSLIKHKLLESNKLKWLAGITALIPGNILLPYPAEDLFWVTYKKTSNESE